MIEVKRITGGDPLLFEIIVREGSGTTRHTVSMSQDACARLTAPTRAMPRGGLPVSARSGAEGVDPPTLRRHGDLALFPRVRARAAALYLATRARRFELEGYPDCANSGGRRHGREPGWTAQRP